MSSSKSKRSLKKISVAKLAVDVLIVAGIVTSCSVIVDDISEAIRMTRIEDAREQIEAGASVQTATVPEYDFKCMKPVEYAVPVGDTSFKSYMDWRCITNTDSDQYHLQEKCWTDDNGLRRYNDYYVIAVGSYYSTHIGEKFTISLDNGNEFTAVVGDFKADKHTDSLHRYTLTSAGSKNVIEFVVDTKSLPDMARKMGDISYVNGFDGNIDRIEGTIE